MQLVETVAEKVGHLLDAEVEGNSDKYIIKKNRTLQICTENVCFTCALELDIFFKRMHGNGIAFNKAEILLLPEELKAFNSALMEHEITFPTSFRQWQVENPHIIAVNIESMEPPENFAARLASALQVIDNKEFQLDRTWV
ncbi:DUF1259 domain-containing protein [Planococcus sp. 1R117A]|uniref:DUF1259 domain-containing protein n=1 Tax=Planococcus sp. 1R117A TaxID=3447020 RepID=UPI003EDC5A74